MQALLFGGRGGGHATYGILVPTRDRTCALQLGAWCPNSRDHQGTLQAVLLRGEAGEERRTRRKG